MTFNPNSEEFIAQRVADFLERHGKTANGGYDDSGKTIGPETETLVLRPGASTRSLRQPTAPAPQPLESEAAMREMRSVASAISISISRSNLLRDKLKEASRFLLLGFVCAVVALFLALGTRSAASFVFFSALLSLVLGLICTYRSTMIMTRLGRIAKI